MKRNETIKECVSRLKKEYKAKGMYLTTIEGKIEAIKQLFLPDKEVEIIMCSNTEGDEERITSKYYNCEIVFPEFAPPWKDKTVHFVATKKTKKIDDIDSMSPCSCSPHLSQALDKLYQLCQNALRNKYIVEIWDD